jgi:hypothetical protein
MRSSMVDEPTPLLRDIEPVHKESVDSDFLPSDEEQYIIE